MDEDKECHTTNITNQGWIMGRSDDISELAKSLAKAQAVMKGAAKDTNNPFFKSKYADLASVWEACRIPLTENELSVIQLPKPSEDNEILLDTILMHSSGQWVSSTTQIPVSKDDAQGYGSALTYARRYGLSSMVGVAPEDDDGNAAAKAHPMAARNTITPSTGVWEGLTEGQRHRLTDLVLVVKEYLEQGDIDSAVKELEEAGLNNEEKIGIWTKFDSKQRRAMKDYQK